LAKTESEAAMRIDSHHHVWDLSVREQGWMVGEALNPIKKNFSINDLRQAITGCGIDKTVVVQTVTNYDETPELLELADTDDLVAGVVGFLKIDADDAIAHLDSYQSLRGFKYLVGIRDIAHDYEDVKYLSKPQVVKNVQELGRRGLVYDLLTKTPHMRAAIDLVKACPNTKFVLDHISKPYIAKADMQPWADQITELASFENVVVKVSGLFTEADWKNWKKEDFWPYLEHITKSFTPNRMMFGSDWPVCLLAATYKQSIDLVEEFTSKFSESEKNAFWAGTANKAYGLNLI
jgi:L-fuconolactonase